MLSFTSNNHQTTDIELSHPPDLTSYDLPALTDNTDNIVFRRFGALNTQILLHLQQDLLASEEQLRSYESGADERAHLIECTSQKLTHYSKYIITA
jgi:hypothetical protein